mmetsp:Transcript_30042/g.54761  ORF Transcript_30042/g.54761 Transcript_30042/m.54761 type:complete len:470 (+) Transcript_30042:102-1511(+)
MGEELASIQAELQAIKKALRDGGAHLGMQGETLQRYLLQLNEKENLILSRQLQCMAGEAYKLLTAPAKVPPTGPIQAFDKDKLESVADHMRKYESNPQESAKALRALSSLAYASAPQVGEDPFILQQAVRLSFLHPEESSVQLYMARVLCNAAYDTQVALNRLSEPAVFEALAAAMGRSPDGQLGVKASEAVARIVAAEVGSDENPPQERHDGEGALTSLFVVASRGDLNRQGVVAQMVKQLITNEVVDQTTIVKRLVACAGLREHIKTAFNAICWLQLTKLLAAESNDLAQALIDQGAVSAVASLMEAYAQDALAQLACVEAMSSLVGHRWSGLTAFIEVKGVQRIEAAMRAHLDHSVLQTKSIRALVSGVQWPEATQTKAGYSASTSVELTKAAMSKHTSNLELVLTGLEALTKYLDKLSCLEAVKENGGDTLVKGVMAQHNDNSRVQTLGNLVLDTIKDREVSTVS